MLLNADQGRDQKHDGLCKDDQDIDEIDVARIWVRIHAPQRPGHNFWTIPPVLPRIR